MTGKGDPMPMREQSRIKADTVATGGVPTGFRLGDGWEVVGGITDWGCSQEIDSDHCNDTPAFVGPAEDSSHPAWQAGACSAHAVEMGALVPVAPARSAPLNPPPSDPVTVATGGNCPTVMDLIADLGKSLVPIDTARSVPPGPVPLEARPSETLTDLLRWQPTAAEVQAAQLPAAPASEPAVRPLSEALRAAAEDLKRLLQYRDADGRLHSPAHGVLGAWKNLVRRFEEVAALEAERDALSDSLADERLTSARARTEVEQLRGKLAEMEKEAREWQEAAVGNEQTADERVLAAGDQATARVRSMREAAESAGYLEATKHHETLLEKGQAVASAIRALPLDTGTATDAPGAVTPAKGTP